MSAAPCIRRSLNPVDSGEYSAEHRLVHIGDLCKKARKSLGLSAEEFCALADIRVEELLQFEAEPSRRNPDTLPRIAHAFKLCNNAVQARHPVRVTKPQGPTTAGEAAVERLSAHGASAAAPVISITRSGPFGGGPDRR